MSLLSHVVNSSNEDYLSANNSTVYSKNIIEIEATNSSSHSTTVTNVTEEASFNYISYNNEERPKLTTTSTNLTVFNSACASTDITKRYQTKMLLASLIEHFCKAYGDKPDANRKVFFLICQTLRSLGIIDAEFVDEMTSVRSSFQQAFHKLFFTAVQTVRNQDLLQFDDNLPRLIKQQQQQQQQEETDYFANDNNSSESCYSSSTTTTSSSSSISKSNAIKVRKQKKNKNKEKDYFSSCASSSNDIGGISFASLNLTPPTSSKLSTSNSTLHSFVHAGDIFQNLSVQNSRYNNDFVELNLLGKGGFASAFRARNKLDGIDYAVKKIRLGNDIEESDRLKENPYEKIFREIKNLARLEHINVIRYYASWLEFDESNSREDSDESDWEVDSTRIKSNVDESTTRSEHSIFNGYDPTFDDSDFNNNNNYNMPSESGMSQIQFGDDSGGYEAGKNDSSSVSTRPSSISNKTSTESIPRQTGWTLFIQMQLCATTLHDYIRSRNKKCAEDESYMNDQVDTDRNIEIFSQILQGTAYIHDQGLIHRDLKPSNIFLSMSNNNQQEGRRKRTSSSSTSTTGGLESLSSSYRSSNDVTVSENGPKDGMWEESWVPKIGDFGLAAEALEEGENGDAILVPTPISSTPPSPKFPTTTTTTTDYNTYTTDENIDPIQLDITTNSNNSRPKRPKPKRTRTIGVGTRTYASPEQLAIPAQAYDEKVDIYSLGIILFELFQPFTTGMERADYLEKLKHGVFPEGFLEMYPKVSALIIWMMDIKPDQRPSARQLLEFELFSQPEDLDICATLQVQLQKKTTIIEELKKKVERVELEKRQAIDEMQQKLDDMQRQLDNLQQGTHHHHHHTSDSKHGFLKKCSILTHPPSVLKKKKEVRWSEA